MVINKDLLYSMLTSQDYTNVEMGLMCMKYYKGTDKKLVRLINFFKILKNHIQYDGGTYITYEFKLKLPYLSFANDNKITHSDMPDNLEIEQSLDLSNCKGLKRLPDNLTVGYLLIGGTKVSKIPKNLNVGKLYFKDTPLYKKYTNEDQLKRDIEANGGSINN